MMPNVIAIILLSALAQVHTKDFIDKLVDELIYRALSVWPFHDTELHNTMLGKPGIMLGKPGYLKTPLHRNTMSSGFYPLRPVRRFRPSALASGSIFQRGVFSLGSAPEAPSDDAGQRSGKSRSVTNLKAKTFGPNFDKVSNVLKNLNDSVSPSSEKKSERSRDQSGIGKSSQKNLQLDISGPPKALRLNNGFALLAHPEKEDKGGEDAFFVSEDGCILGVADGVGGWSDMGVDPGLYSKQLMQNAKEVADELEQYDALTPNRIMALAHNETNIQGSSTCCVLVLQDDKLHGANLGDSGFVVLRGEEMIFQSPSQQHEFNFPFQLGGPGSRADMPDVADSSTLQLLPGDTIIAGSDGLWDNVYPDDITRLVKKSKDEGLSPSKIAPRLASYARKRGEDEKYLSPFAHGAISLGLWYIGGKLDDIVVIVSSVEEASTK